MRLQMRAVCAAIVLGILTGFAGCITSPSVPSPPTVPPHYAPFADEDAELAALYLAGTLTAPDSLYASIHRGLAAVHARYDAEIPDLAGIHVRTPWRVGTSSLLMSLTDAARDDVRAGTYHALDALNASYQVTRVDTTLLDIPHVNALLLSFAGRLHPQRLVEVYRHAGARGVVIVEPNYIYGDGSMLYARRMPDGAMAYLFRLGGGDCPSGCTINTYWYFRTRGDAVEYVGTLGRRTGTLPDWWQEAQVTMCLWRYPGTCATM